MKITSPLANGTYCLACQQTAVYDYRVDGKLAYRCSACGHADERALIIDPAINWWLAPDGEYWHEVAGVFLRGAWETFLFFERTKYPFGLTVPAGHVDYCEQPLLTAQRELQEEVGVTATTMQHVVDTDIPGDSCRRGSDAHHWHVFAAPMPHDAILKVDAQEGERPVWLTLSQALQNGPTFAVHQVITRFARSIIAATS